MSTVIVITSGKGGVGKSTTSANLAMGLAQKGYKTAAVDFDVGLQNLDVYLGCYSRHEFNMIDYIEGTCRNLKQALVRHKSCKNLYFLSSSQTKNKDVLNKEDVGRVIEELRKEFDYIICDSPAGIENGALMAMYHADEAIVVTNPEVSSIRDSDRMIGILQSRSKKAENGEDFEPHLLITRYDPKRVRDGNMLSIEDIKEQLEVEVIGVIPEDSESIINSSNSGEPVITDQTVDAGKAYEDLVNRVSGEDCPLRFTEVKKGFFARVFGG